MFPAYDPHHLPYFIADNNKIFDTKLLEVISKLTDIEDPLEERDCENSGDHEITLGFLKKSNKILCSGG